MVATVERGLLERLFWSMEIAGESPDISSTSGFCICRKNCRAYAESDSTYFRCPSAKMVSNASEDFPLPESPVKTTILWRGTSTLIFFKLCVRAPFMTILPAPSAVGGSLSCFFDSDIYTNPPSVCPRGGYGRVYYSADNPPKSAVRTSLYSLFATRAGLPSFSTTEYA